MIPKAGDIVKLNPYFLKVWFKRGNKYLKEICKEKFTVTEIDTFIDELIVKFKFKDFKYMLYILSNGEFSTFNSNKYKGIQVFISPNISEINNNIYCSCNGPVRENWAGGKKFYVCIVCKKEKLMKYLKVEDEKFINEWKRNIDEFYKIIKGK